MSNKFKNLFFELKLAYKLGAFFLLLLLFITTLVYLYFPTRSKKQQIGMMTKKIELVSEITISFIQYAINSEDPVLIKKAVTPIKSNEEIKFYFIADSLGKIFEFDKIHFINKYAPVLTKDTIYITNDNNYLIKIKPILSGNKVVGYLGMGITLETVNSYISSLKRNIFVFVVLLLALGMYLIIVYSNFILKPLFTLSNSIQGIANGNYSEKVEILHLDEIGKLSVNFNKMAENLKETHNKLKIEISQRKDTEEELLITQKHLFDSLEKQKELNLLKSRFISMISHEYRTPLTAITNSTYLIEQYAKRSDVENVEKYSARIKASVDRLTDLLNDVLKVSQAEKLRIDVKLSETNLLSFCNTICDEMKLINDRNNLICYVEDINIEIDTKLFHLISKNLISNSFKYSNKNTDVFYSCKKMNNKALVLIVKDNGIGMSKEDLANLFVPFHRGENVGAIEGTGLGMAIIKDSVEILSGFIEVTSELNQFTEFKITFPLVNNCMVINPKS